MAFDAYEKSYMNNLKQTLTEDQWEQFLGLPKPQQKTQLVNRIDQDIASLDQGLLNLDIQKAQRELQLNDQKTKLTALKTKVEAL